MPSLLLPGSAITPPPPPSPPSLERLESQWRFSSLLPGSLGFCTLVAPSPPNPKTARAQKLGSRHQRSTPTLRSPAFLSRRRGTTSCAPAALIVWNHDTEVTPGWTQATCPQGQCRQAGHAARSKQKRHISQRKELSSLGLTAPNHTLCLA